MDNMFDIIELGNVRTVTTQSACNHVYVVDVSGSMYSDLPKVRQHLKNIISVIAKPEDTFSVIWFSGRGQCGVVFENWLVSDIQSVSAMHGAIDRYLKPVGLTGFTDPIILSMSLNLTPGKVNSFIMMTDGYDNQSSKTAIIEAASRLPAVYKNVAFIEYGYYADRDMLAKMAEAASGVHLFADGYDKYEEAMSVAFTGTARVPMQDVRVSEKVKAVLYTYNSTIRIVQPNLNVVSVPEDVSRLYAVNPSASFSKLADDHLYVVLYYAVKTGDDALTWKALAALGDIALVEAYQNAFTKQELSIVEDLVVKAVFDTTARFVDGRSDNAVPNKNAKTVIDLLSLLAASSASLVLSSMYWDYNKIGRSSELAGEVQLPRFERSALGQVDLKTLVFNSERPNISIQTKLNGTVELPANKFQIERVPCFIYRNYAIIKDGTKNVQHIPVMLDDANFTDELKAFPHTVIESGSGKTVVAFHLKTVPVINRSKVQSLDINKVANVVVNVESLKARLKVIGYFIDKEGGTSAKIQGMIDKYGEEAAKWLSEIGVRDYGFSPTGTTSVEATDEYMAMFVNMKIAGMSSLPSVNAVLKKVAEKKKLNVADNLILTYYNQYENADIKKLEEEKQTNIELKRFGETMLADIVYTIVLGRVWFNDTDEASVPVVFEGVSTTLTIIKERKAVKI